MTTEKKLEEYSQQVFKSKQVLCASDLNTITKALAAVNTAVLALEGQEGNGGAALNLLIDYRTEWKAEDVLAAGMLGIEYDDTDINQVRVRFKVNDSEKNDFWGNLSYAQVMKPLDATQIDEICE